MKRKSIFLMIACLLMTALFGTNTVKADTVDDVWSVIDGIAMFKMSECGAGSMQEWADGALCEGAGTDADAYAFALYKLGKADVTAYKEALRKYLDENTVRSATTRLKYALCLCMDATETAHDDPADEQYISQTVEDSVGKLGVMSLVYGLHLAGNGHVGTEYPVGRILDELMSLRHEDGGWSVMGQYSDVDVTAMVLQSLAVMRDTLQPQVLSSAGASEDDNREEVLKQYETTEDGIRTGLAFLSGKQNETGDFAGFGSDNAESTAQVLIALSSLGIDGASAPEFVKNGHSVIDGIMRYRLPDGSFAHIPGGDSNPTATSQVFTAMASYICYKEGSIYYRIDRFKALSRESSDAENPKTEEHVQESTDGSELGSKDSLNSEADNSVTDIDSQVEQNLKPAENQSKESISNSQIVPDSDNKTVEEDQKKAVSISDEEAKNGEKQILESSEKTVTEDGSGNDLITIAPVDDSETSPIKGILYIGILGIAVLASVLLVIFKKRNPKNFIFVLIVAGLAATAVFFSDFATGTDYYRSETLEGEVTGEVTFTIRCDTIAGLGDSEFIPEDGCILKETTYAFAQDETVYDILVRAVKDNKLHMEKKKTGSGPRDYYICGIANIYEYDWGELSGWMYYVNGESPSVGCGE
ncbi:MAG: DUF4430 domain-containing protein, partial [Lachnospiraceae bacterium]|nr:DUF4430 domain-containing protein [Lachnospiraceae bacterium]